MQAGELGPRALDVPRGTFQSLLQGLQPGAVLLGLYERSERLLQCLLCGALFGFGQLALGQPVQACAQVPCCRCRRLLGKRMLGQKREQQQGEEAEQVHGRGLGGGRIGPRPQGFGKLEF